MQSPQSSRIPSFHRQPPSRARRAWAGRALVTAIVAAPALVSVSPSPEAKSPGASWCYRDVCHRVRTIEETQALVGRTLIIDASFYDEPRFDRMNRGKHTSNGEVFDADNPARVSSSDYPDGTELLLRNPENGRTSHVRVNDFGPFYGGRLLDVTKRVAVDLGFQKRGVARIEATVLAAPLAEDTGYRLNRVMTPALGHVGVLDAAQAAHLVERLVHEQPAQRLAVLASATGPAAVLAPAAMRTASATTLPDTPADLPMPDVEAPSPSVLASLLTRPPTVSVGTAAAEAVDAAPVEIAELPPAELELADIFSRPPPVLLASALPSETVPRLQLPSVAPTVVEPAIEVPLSIVRLPAQLEPAKPETADPAIVVAAVDQLPADAIEQSTAGQSASVAGTDTPPTYGFQRLHRVIAGMTVGILPTSLALITRTSGPNMMISVLIAGLLSLALATAWGLTRLWPKPARASAPRKQAAIAARNTMTPVAAPGLGIDPIPAAAALPAIPLGLLQTAASPLPTIAIATAAATGTSAGLPAANRAAQTGGSLVDADVTIEGTLSSKGRIAVAGIVVGDITAQALEILPGGRVEGRITADTVTVGGTFAGSIVATHVSIGAQGDLTGDVVSQTIDAHIDARMEADFRRPRQA